MRIAAFDIGFKNFAFCVEEISYGFAHPQTIVYQEDGTVHTSSQIEQLFQHGRIVHTGLEECEFEPTFQQLTHILDSQSPLWDTVDVFLIEAQIAFGKNANIKAFRISQHVLSYFSVIYGPFKNIIEFSSTYKTRLLGCPLAQRRVKRDRKQFSIRLAATILALKHQSEQFDSFKKKDDVSDCLLMIQALKVLLSRQKK
jgi:hypothetical protein